MLTQVLTARRTKTMALANMALLATLVLSQGGVFAATLSSTDEGGGQLRLVKSAVKTPYQATSNMSTKPQVNTTYINQAYALHAVEASNYLAPDKVASPIYLEEDENGVVSQVKLTPKSATKSAAKSATKSDEDTNNNALEALTELNESHLLDAISELPARQETQLIAAASTGGSALKSVPKKHTVDSLTTFISDYNKKLSFEQSSVIAQSIMRFSNLYKVDARVITSVLAVESSFRADAISSSGAIGLGQLKPDTARWLGVVNPYDPIDNVAGSTRFLAWLSRKYNGRWDQALSAYYQGPGHIDRNGVTEECLPYLLKVNNVLKHL